MTRTRIAPSPTGNDIHIGNLYTALINWVVAQKAKKVGKDSGQFIIRIEDTDRTRYVDGAEEKIVSSLLAYGLTPDESPLIGGSYAPYRQSERLELYKEKAQELVRKGKAYYSFVSKEQLDKYRGDSLEEAKKAKEAGKDSGVASRLYLRSRLRDPSVACYNLEEAKKRISDGEEYTIRLLVPENTIVSFNDYIRGEISISTDQIDDQVLLKSDGFPTYHLAVVVDDFTMEITHIIRAEEWIASTPKHILLYDAFGWDKPVFAHLPILRNPDKSKLSKRKNPVWAAWYLEQGYLPEAMLNYLALMGWSHPAEKEMFGMEEFIDVFELKNVHPVGPVFDVKKLEWLNGMYIRSLSTEELTKRIMSYYGSAEEGGESGTYQGVHYEDTFVMKTVPLVQERIKLLSEYAEYVDFLLHRPVEFELDLIEYRNALKEVARRLEGISDWEADNIGNEMLACASDLNMKNKQFFQMLRVTITGKKVSPPLNESMEILGKEECLIRISNQKI